MCLEGLHRACPHILRYQPTSFLLFPLGTLGGGGVLSIKGISRYQNTKMGAYWVGEVFIFQGDACVPDVPLQEIYSELRPRG